MNKLKNCLLATACLATLVAALTLIGGPAVLSEASRFTHKGGSKVITLVENLAMVPGGTIELDPVKVGQFSHVSFLGTHDGPFLPVIGDFVFSTEKGISTDDSLPRNRFGCNIGGGSNGGVAFCNFDQTGRVSTLRVGGPFLAGRLTNDTGTNVSVTLKVYLSR
jgi:hypothetical protein